MTKAGIFKLGESGLDVSPLEQQREFSYQIRIYDRSGNKVAEIASGIKNVTLEQLQFGYLQDGGNADFSFTLGEEFTQTTIGYNYRVELCFYNQPNPWYSGFITKLPEKGTSKKQTYSGYGYAKQLSWIRVNEDDVAEEVADIIEDTVDDYIVGNTDIIKDSDKLDSPIYQMVSNIYWNRVPANDLFEKLRQLAGDYEWGVDEERDFYFRAINTNVLDNFWIGKHLDTFKGMEDPDSVRNKLYVKCGRLTDGSDYVFFVENAASQAAYGLREDVIIAPEFYPTFSTTDLASGILATTSPAGAGAVNMTDGNAATLWDSGAAQGIGNYIQVDLGASFDRIARVVVDSSDDGAAEQFARGFDIRISATGAFAGEEVVVFTTTAWSTDLPDVRFEPVTGRYVRITLTIADTEDWHVGLFEVYELDTSDIERWANYLLTQKKDPRKKASLTIKAVNQLIETKHVIKPFKPYGKWGIYAEDGTKIEDYQVKSVKYSLTGNSFNMSAELGQLERESVPAEFKRQLQRLEEFNMSGIRKTDDLASGTGAKPLGITRTIIGPNVIEVPHLKGNKISLHGGLVELGEGVMSAGGHGFIVHDGTYYRVEIGKLNGDYGLTIRDAGGNVMINLGSFAFGNAKARAYSSLAVIIQPFGGTGGNTIVRLDTETYDPGSNFDNSVWFSGNTTATNPNKLEDGGAAFVAGLVGYTVLNTTDNTYAQIKVRDSGTILSLSTDIFTIGEGYSILNSKFVAAIAGDYLCLGKGTFLIDNAAFEDEHFQVDLVKNGVRYTRVSNETGSKVGARTIHIPIMDIIPLAVNDEIELRMWVTPNQACTLSPQTEGDTFLACHLFSVTP